MSPYIQGGELRCFMGGDFWAVLENHDFLRQLYLLSVKSTRVFVYLNHACFVFVYCSPNACGRYAFLIWQLVAYTETYKGSGDEEGGTLCLNENLIKQDVPSPVFAILLSKYVFCQNLQKLKSVHGGFSQNLGKSKMAAILLGLSCEMQQCLSYFV